MYTASLLLFQRDLRLHDNPALNTALGLTDRVYPCFILDRDLLRRTGQTLPRVQYLLMALQQLDRELRMLGSQLHVVSDHYEQGLTRLQQACNAQAVFCHRDFGPTARQRHNTTSRLCRERQVQHHAIDSLTLHPPEKTLKADGTPYTVFTPFFRRTAQLTVAQPAAAPHRQRLARLPATAGDFSLDTALAAAGLAFPANREPLQDARKAMAQLGNLQGYNDTRDMPALTGTSRLSASLRFGLVSPREAWWAIAQQLGNEHPLLRQLYWRDFFYSIGHYFPHVFSGCFHHHYDAIPWPNRQDWLNAWREGRTGFPIVDAGMRELAATGYMHNRVRMIAASFLVKDLHCNWRLGERHFAAQLIDYDPCINNGNWQWAASTGCDAQPYFRIFNPWVQQQKFDANCTYIKRWLPELQPVPARTLHRLDQLDHALPDYVMPIVDHSTQAAIAKSLFKAIRPDTYSR